MLTKSKLVTNSTGKSVPQEEGEEEDLVTQELKILQAEVFLRGLLRKPEKQRNGTGRKGHAEGKRWLASEWEKLTSRNNGESNIKAGESTMARRRNTEGTAKRRDPLVDISEKIQIVMELLATSHLRSLDDKDGRNIILDRLDKIIRKSQKGLRGNFVRWSNNTMRDGNSTSRNVTNSTEIERTRERFRNLLDEYSSLKHAGGSSRRSGITSLAKSSLSKEDQSSAFLLSVPQVSGISYYSGCVYCSIIII